MRVSITLLQYDHGLIRQVIDVLGEAVKRRTAEKHLEEMKEIVGFMDRFMDGFHHRKEENFLFASAVKAGTLTETDRSDLVADHAEARRLVNSLHDALIVKDYGRFYMDGRKIVDHMTAHIRTEEDMVFPKIEEGLSSEEDMAISKRFEEFQAEKFSEDLYPITERFANWVQDNVLGPGYFEDVR